MKRTQSKTPTQAEDPMQLEYKVGEDEGNPLWKNAQDALLYMTQTGTPRPLYGTLPSNSASALPTYPAPTQLTQEEVLRKQLAGLRLEAKKRALFDGEKWTFTLDHPYQLKGNNKTGEFWYKGKTRKNYYAFMYNGRLVEIKNTAIQVQLSDGSWYYPWGEPKQDVPETVRPPSCQHEYVDVGFMHPKVVCKFCDKEKGSE